MSYLILEMREESGWGDSNIHYEFPARYLRQFEEAMAGGPAIALIYEPKRAGGRMAYVAWTRINRVPVRNAVTGAYTVDFDSGLRSFDQPVPFALNGIPVEHRLREVAPRDYGRAVQGRAVRAIPEANAVEILALGSATYTRTRVYDIPGAAIDARERVRRTIEQIERDAKFRDLVLRNYSFRCSITGLGIGPNPASRLHGVLDAAHLKPVAHSGPDLLCNGIAMTPTLHRLFDGGLFTLVARRDRIVVETSPQLDGRLLSSGRTQIHLVSDMEVALPAAAADRPSRDFLSYHREHIFLKTA